MVGGGIIGLCCAWYLQQEGYVVTIFDAGDMTDNCSQGNAGYVTPSHFVPLASPGVLAQGFRWMFSKKSPFYIKPGLNKNLLYWGWQFYKHCTEQHVSNAKFPLRDINMFSRELFVGLATELDFDFQLNAKGCLMLCKTSNAFKHECELIGIAASIGIEATAVRADELSRFIPGTATDAAGGVFFAQDMHVDPPAFTAGLRKILEEKGVQFVLNTPVQLKKNSNGKIVSVAGNDRSWQFDEYILAAGSMSGKMAEELDLRVPLQGGKGYSFTVPGEHKIFETPVILVEGRVAIAPLKQHIRYGGTMEIDGHKKQVSYHRVEGIAKSVNDYFPELQLQAPPLEKVWYGYRPCSPDGLPYIGRISKIPNLTIATGHAMMGFGLGPATGKLVTEIIGGKRTSIDINAFDPSRYL